MCLRRTQQLLSQARAWLVWLMPTKTQRWGIGFLLVLMLGFAGHSERKRRDELFRVTAEQAETTEKRLREEIEAASSVHQILQQRIEHLDRRIRELERKQSGRP